MLAEDVFFLPAGVLGARIRARHLSPIELTEGYLDRIAKQNGRLNAYHTVTADLARQQAREAEQRASRGKLRSPLDGVPYGAKDLFDTKGIRTGWGTRFLNDRVPDSDATVVRKLAEAGAVLLGKTAMVECAGGLGYRFASASVSGPGRNPWDPSRWTGGSSSGSGGAVAAGLAAFALGTETWGSILCPSAFCGLTGLRPTYGVVSRAGAMACAYTFDKVGPIARTAGDCRLVMHAIAGPDPLDPTGTDAPPDFRARATRPLRQLRAALVPLDWKETGEPEVKARFDEAVDELRRAGLSLELAELPAFPASEVAGLLITVEALAAFGAFFDDGRVKELTDDIAPHQRELNEQVTGADVTKAMRMRHELQVQTAEFFGRWDVIVSPNFKSVAPPVEMDFNQAFPYGDPVGAIGNACGLPAIALPGGTAAHGMPAGFQIMAAPYDDALLLELGELYQSRTRHHLARPPQT